MPSDDSRLVVVPGSLVDVSRVVVLVLPLLPDVRVRRVPARRVTRQLGRHVMRVAAAPADRPPFNRRARSTACEQNTWSINLIAHTSVKINVPSAKDSLNPPSSKHRSIETPLNATAPSPTIAPVPSGLHEGVPPTCTRCDAKRRTDPRAFWFPVYKTRRQSI